VFPGYAKAILNVHPFMNTYNNNRNILFVGEIFCKKANVLDQRGVCVSGRLLVFLTIRDIPRVFFLSKL
jgi:hypothetical protein